MSGYDSTRDLSSGIDISQAIANFSISPTIDDAKQILMNVDGEVIPTPVLANHAKIGEKIYYMPFFLR